MIYNHIKNDLNIKSIIKYMKMFKHVFDLPKIWLRTSKQIKYETIDFTFNPKHIYMFKIIPKTNYKIPNVPYKDQYESRDF